MCLTFVNTMKTYYLNITVLIVIYFAQSLLLNEK